MVRSIIFRPELVSFTFDSWKYQLVGQAHLHYQWLELSCNKLVGWDMVNECACVFSFFLAKFKTNRNRKMRNLNFFSTLGVQKY